jgi:hypothetical protein
MSFRKLLILSIASILTLPVQGQLTDDDFNEWVAFKVKSIDDFFERFNGEQNTELNAYLRANYPDRILNRKQWIRSVFNLEKDDVHMDSLMYQFIQQVTDSLNPQYLNYRDNYWYAMVDCTVRDKKRSSPLTLILKVKKSIAATYSWSVVSAHAAFLSKKDSAGLATDTLVLTADSTHKYFLSPVSHGIDFITLDKFFKSRTKVRNYLLQQKNTEETEKLVGMISKGELIFEQVRKVKYYMLQIKGWILEIDYLNRPGRNTGWLANSLMKVNASQKRDFMIKQLYIPMSK